ncbi:hypothetical protein GYMLUDRAFT_218232 [Collybiopsis luxurians FD-317 M1]|nr:hypothetical protein GYMLUDRAFT_218232 [Collybiopsis luxurians FD-317 M1]
MNTEERNQQRYYASKDYILPNDEIETRRLNRQHRIITRAFENRLSLASLELRSGDCVLESAAGTGVWALEFYEQNKEEGIELNIDCIDISDKQFPTPHPPNINFSVHSVVDLPAEWSGSFSYAHQRLLVGALNASRWRKAVSELFRVLSPGGQLELVDQDINGSPFGIGPWSKKLDSLILKLYADWGVVNDLGEFLPPILAEVGFVDIRREVRHIPVGRSGEHGFRSDEWVVLWKAMKAPVLNAGGFGYVQTEEEYEELLQESVQEWDSSSGASAAYYTILARKP